MRAFVLIAIFALHCSLPAQGFDDFSNGMPFGPVGEAQINQLFDFAKASGVDLKADLETIYGENVKQLDADALGRVFAFSLAFNSLDQNARTYGQIIFSSLLNIGEVVGVSAYAKIIDRQPPKVQQRIRDFLFYPIAQRVPKQEWPRAFEENQRVYPGLFPKSF